MKDFLIPLTVFLFPCLHGATRQDYDTRFESFLTESLTQLPNWMKDNGYVPDPLHSTTNGEFIQSSIDGAGFPFLYLAGEFKNHFYHGADKNIKFVNLKANVTDLFFKFNLTYGDRESDYVTGDYVLDGHILETYPIHGNGTFNKTNLIGDSYLTDAKCVLQVNDGYFKFYWCEYFVRVPRFANLTLNGFGESDDEKEIKDMVNLWYNFQINDAPNTVIYFFRYLTRIFEVTPIVDIIGSKLPHTGRKLTNEKEMGNKSPTYTKSKHYDNEKKAWYQKVSVTF